MVRALIDVNVLISALLNPDRAPSVVNAVVEAGLRRRFALVFPDDVADELRRVTGQKPHLRRRIQPADVSQLIAVVRLVGECPRALDVPPSRLCRDPNDDYLVEHAIRNAVDVLISGDPDLLELDGTGLPFRIMNPRDFLALLDRDTGR